MKLDYIVFVGAVVFLVAIITVMFYNIDVIASQHNQTVEDFESFLPEPRETPMEFSKRAIITTHSRGATGDI